MRSVPGNKKVNVVIGRGTAIFVSVSRRSHGQERKKERPPVPPPNPMASFLSPSLIQGAPPCRIGPISAATSQPSPTLKNWVDSTDAEFFQRDTRPIMLFDGVCNLCNGGVRFVRDNDRNRKIRYEALQSESGRKLLQRSGRSPDDISSVVLVEKDRSHIKSEAVLKIMEYLDLPFPQLAILLRMVPLFIRDFAYDNVANNRYAIFGRSESESCEI